MTHTSHCPFFPHNPVHPFFTFRHYLFTLKHSHRDWLLHGHLHIRRRGERWDRMSFLMWQLRNHCIHSCHWDLPTLMLKFVPPEWVSPLDYEEENSGPIRSVLVGSSSPVEAQPLGDWSPPGLVTEWLVSVPALPGPQAPHLEDEQTPFMSAPSESQHLHLTPSRSPAFCWKPLPWSSSVLRAAVLSSLPPAQFSMTGWLHDTCWPHL